MRFRTYKNTDLAVSEVGFGMWTISTGWWGKYTEGEALTLMRKAFDLGVTLFDAADTYGNGLSEEYIAKAFPKNRDEIVIATKVGYDFVTHAAAELVRKKLEWVVRLGCLLPVFFVVGCGLLAFLFATGIMKQSDAYKIALARAQANPVLIEAIGSPISQTGIVSGNSNVSGAVGEANLSIPLSGPKGKATLYVEAKKSADT